MSDSLVPQSGGATAVSRFRSGSAFLIFSFSGARGLRLIERHAPDVPVLRVGLPSPDLAWRAAYLIALGVAGLALAGQRIAKLLLV
jgi:hypothetical protein